MHWLFEKIASFDFRFMPSPESEMRRAEAIVSALYLDKLKGSSFTRSIVGLLLTQYLPYDTH